LTPGTLFRRLSQIQAKVSPSLLFITRDKDYSHPLEKSRNKVENLTISLDYRGSAERGQNIFTDTVREQPVGKQGYLHKLVRSLLRRYHWEEIG
jgi:hypothetical protein